MKFSEIAEGVLEAETPISEEAEAILEEEEGAKEGTQEEKAFLSLIISRDELGRTPSRADEPASRAEDDLLGRKHLVEALSEMIADENQGTPFTIGLLGRWGAGKSTVMKMLQDVLKKRVDGDRFKFAEFNAWEYERTDNLGAGLAQEVVRSLVEPLGVKKKLLLRYEFALREHGPKVLFSLGFAMLILLGVFIEIILIASNLMESGKDWWFETLFGGGLFVLTLKLWDHYKKLYEHPLSVELRTYLKLPNYGKHLGLIPVLKRHIRILCQIRLGTVQKRKDKRKEELEKWDRLSLDKSVVKEGELPSRLVVFIDDLDRCDPKSITKTLDAVRLVMDVQDVIVILGIDHRIAFRAVGEHYKDLADNRHSKQAIARDYLGKILQLAIVLNQPQAKELKSFVSQGLFPNAEALVNEKVKTTDRNKKESSLTQSNNEAKKTTPENSFESISPEDRVKDQEAEKTEGKEEGEEVNLWREEIRFSTKERDLFGELAVVFEFSNPRQLLRLRNSYGLLKLLHGTGTEIPFTPSYKEQAPKELKAILMILLFWKEFEANHPIWAKQVLEPPKNEQRKHIVLKITDRMGQPDIGGLDFSLSGLTATATFVELFVLPCGEEQNSEEQHVNQ